VTLTAISNGLSHRLYWRGDHKTIEIEKKIHNCSQLNVVKTYVRKTMLAPKTKFSIRSVKMSDNVKEAFRRQRRRTRGKTEYVFLNKPGEV